jgi:nucleoside-diphosphate-sugar epimerase
VIRCTAPGPYAEAKIEGEHLCEAARLSGACVSVLRPTNFVGPRENRDALTLSRQRYANGLVNFIDVLDAERTLQQNERFSPRPDRHCSYR